MKVKMPLQGSAAAAAAMHSSKGLEPAGSLACFSWRVYVCVWRSGGADRWSETVGRCLLAVLAVEKEVALVRQQASSKPSGIVLQLFLEYDLFARS